ncbi:MAG: exported protein of unknown function [Candidatus Thorarchaeota archaeon]|nr:MAG: exported protein of unknown function [Candidatus Thorarchaeota archaeon]
MKLKIFIAVFVVLLLLIPTTSDNIVENQSSTTTPLFHKSSFVASSLGSGSNSDSVMYFERTISYQEMLLQNSYATPNNHQEGLSFEQYHISGWSLYKAEMKIDNITAGLEFEVLGVSKDDLSSFSINNSTGDPYDILSQELYNQPHNGLLENYSFYYSNENYNPTYQNYAFLVIRSKKSDPSTNMTSAHALPSKANFEQSWYTITEQTNLSADISYYLLLDGEKLVEYFSTYPVFKWICETGAGSYATQRHYSFGDQWTLFNRNALLNYTYTPWDTNTNSALVFNSPEEIFLQANGTNLSGDTWSWTTTDNNLEQIIFSSNQSISIYNNITLYYKKTGVAENTWSIETSGSDVTWNTTTMVSYPDDADSNSMKLNLTIQSEWGTNGLYKDTSPENNHTFYTREGNVIISTDITNGTWTLSSTGFNYVREIGIFQQSDYSKSIQILKITDILDVIPVIKDGAGMNATSGSTNLTLWHDSEVKWAPENETLINGSTNYTWNVSSTTSENGKYRIEVYWTNGTEAGYLTEIIDIYYTTFLTAITDSLTAFTESSFEIEVQYYNNFSDIGIDETGASLVYDFGGTNYTMSHQTNGTWKATVNTIGFSNGPHSITVYAEGYGYHNRTVAIDVILLHEAKLDLSWESKSIDWTESTIFSVNYTKLDGSLISGANQLDLYIDSQLLELQGTNGTYWIELNNTFGLGVHSLELNISKQYFESVFNDTVSFEITEANTTLAINWDSSEINYLETFNLTVSYTYTPTGTFIDAIADNVNITIDGTTTLNMNNSGNFWIANLTGFYLDLGSHELTIEAWKYGYVYRTDTLNISVLNVSTSMSVSWNPANVEIQHVDNLELNVDYTYDTGDVPDDALVNVTINGNIYNLAYTDGSWSTIIPCKYLGVGEYSATIEAWRYGYSYQTNITYGINITIAYTTMMAHWNFLEIDYIGQLDLTVNYTMNINGTSVPTSSTFMNITIDGGSSIELNQSGNLWTANLTGIYLDLGTHNITIKAWSVDFEYQVIYSSVNVTTVLTSLQVTWNPNDVTIEHVQNLSVSADYTYHSGDVPDSAIVNVSIDGKYYQFSYTGAVWECQITGSDFDVGFYEANVTAWAYGFDVKINITAGVNITQASTSLTLVWTSTSTDYLGWINLTASYVVLETGESVPLSTPNINITIDGSTPLALNQSGNYWVANLTGSYLNLGTHNVVILAWSNTYQEQEILESLVINNVTTSLSVIWNPNNGKIERVENFALSVDYTFFGGDVPTPAHVNVSIDDNDYTLTYSSGVWSVTISGLDFSVGEYSAVIHCWKYGYAYQTNTTTINITITETNLDLNWSSLEIDYLGQIDLVLNYTVSITGDYVPALSSNINITIDGKTAISLNQSGNVWTANLTGIYLDLGNHSVTINAWSDSYAAQEYSTYLNVSEVLTFMTVTWNPSDVEIEHVENLTLIIDYTYSEGDVPISAQVNTTINGITYSLTYNGSNWQVLISGSDIGVGVFSATVSSWRYGYAYALNTTSGINVTDAQTNLSLAWTDTTLDYLGQIELTVNYSVLITGEVVPAVPSEMNVTIDGITTISLNQSGDLWIANLTGIYLDLGDHLLIVQAYADTYEFSQASETITVLNVSTNPLQVIWQPENVTIEYTQYLNLSVAYTYGVEDVPGTALVNITINSLTWSLNYSNGFWEGSIIGEDIGIGIFTAEIAAWLYGYEEQLNLTYNVNITEASNTYVVIWEPSDRTISYIELFNISVIYTHNYEPISDAIINVTFDGSITYNLTFSETDERWHFSINGTNLDLGVHNILIEAWAQGYKTGLTISSVFVSNVTTWFNMDWNPLDAKVDHLSKINLTLDYQHSSGNVPSDAILNLTINGMTSPLILINNRWYISINGSDLGKGEFSAYIQGWRYGFEYITNTTNVNITIAFTNIEYKNSNLSFQYMGQFDIQFNYSYSISGETINILSPNANLTIDGETTIELNQTGDTWTANITGEFLDLGEHEIIFSFWAEGYQEQLLILSLYVENESTYLSVDWNPSNVTIQYTETLEIFVDYEYDTSDVPDTSIVNVTIDAHHYSLSYNGGQWYISIPGETIGIGVFEAVIEAWTYGFEYKTNTTFGINITLAANSFIVDWCPDVLETSFITEFEIRVYFTHDWQPILGANVCLIKNGTIIDYFSYNSTNESYDLLISAKTIDLGLWNITVYANKIGYENQWDSKIYTVIEDSTTHQLSWTTMQISYVNSTTLRVNLTASDHTPLPSVTFQATIDNKIFSGNEVVEGCYEFILGPELSIGIHNITFDASKYGYSFNLPTPSIEIIEAATEAFFHINNKELYYDEALSLSIIYELTNGSVIESATCQLEIDDKPISVQWDFDHWYVTIFSNSLGIGNHNGSLNLTLYGYESQTIDFNLTIQNIPTRLDVSGSFFSYVNQSFTLEIVLTDLRNNSPITPVTFDISWSELFHIDVNSSEVYQIVFITEGFHVGSVPLAISILNEGISDSEWTGSIDIRAIPLNIMTEEEISQYENEMVNISVSIRNAITDDNVCWSKVDLSSDIINTTLYWNDISQYEVSFELPSDNPGNYTLILSIETYDCENYTLSIELEILEKATITITLSSEAEVIAGEDLQVSALVERNNQPVMGAIIEFHATILMNDGSERILEDSQISNNEGICTATFSIPLEAKSLQVWASYDGNVQNHNATSSFSSVSVYSARAQIGELLWNTFSNPLALILFAGLISIILIRKSSQNRSSVKEEPIEEDIVLEAFDVEDSTALSVSTEIPPDDESIEVSLISEEVFVPEFLIIIENREPILSYSLQGNEIAPHLIIAISNEIIRRSPRIGDNFDISLSDLRLQCYRNEDAIGVIVAHSQLTSDQKMNLESLIDMITPIHSKLEDNESEINQLLIAQTNSLFYAKILDNLKIDDIGELENIDKELAIALQKIIDIDQEFTVKAIKDQICMELDINSAILLSRIEYLVSKSVIQPHYSEDKLLISKNLELSDEERILAKLAFSDGMTRAKIAVALDMPISRVGRIIRELLKTKPGLDEIRDGRKRLVVYSYKL